MVRLDRTIGFPKRVLSGMFGPMVRSSRTMTKKWTATRRSSRHFARVGPDPRISRHDANAHPGIAVPASSDPRVEPHGRGDRVSASLVRHGPARPDHRPEHAGKRQFGQPDGLVEPDHDAFSRVPVHRPVYCSAHWARPEDDDVCPAGIISLKSHVDRSSIGIPRTVTDTTQSACVPAYLLALSA